MKKIIILPFLFLGLISWGQAQFVVQNGAKTEVYNNINTAITNAAAGDTLYLPGGGFTISNTTITKTLHWVGHGHYPDSTLATYPSRITNALTFTGACDNSSFEGILFTSNLTFGSSDDEAENIQMKRCRVIGNLSLRAVTGGNPSLNFQISECVLQTIYANNGSNCLVENTQVFGTVERFYVSSFVHNNFNIHASYPFAYCKSCLFTDNVISESNGLNTTESNTFTNNIFAGGLPFTPVTDVNGNDGLGNIYNVGGGNIYTDITHSSNIYTFSYDNDYHLKSGSTGTNQDETTGIIIEGAATDGTNAGIYGSAKPYKTIPYYPHINTATIATEATNGQLDINLNVEAQSR